MPSWWTAGEERVQGREEEGISAHNIQGGGRSNTHTCMHAHTPHIHGYYSLRRGRKCFFVFFK